MKRFLTASWPVVLLLAIVSLAGCKKDKKEVLSGFTYKVDQTDFRKIIFTQAAQNYTALSWDFGDGSTSTAENPEHIYAALGTYTVKLTATGEEGSDVSTQTITISDPDAELTKLTGLESKSWKLLRVVGPGRWPLEVGPIDHSAVWWAQGRDNDEIALRPCIMNDEWIFTRIGNKMEYKTNGDYWAEGGVFEPANECRSSAAGNMTGPGGSDLSAFGDGNHTFVLTPGTNATLEVKGLGAFIGLAKIGTSTEVSTPQQSVKLDIVKMTDGTTDTLILESKWKFANNTSGQPDAYWRVTLVHYDDAAQEPAIPSPKPKPSFTFAINNYDVQFTNTSTLATSYSWDFGDGASSTAESPSHTYSGPGVYKVKLTATNSAGSVTAEQDVTLTSGPMTEANLIGGAWKIRVAANSVFVGPALGDPSWWQVPLSGLDGSSTGGDDWSCMTNDEFIFGAGGVYQYKTNGDARNDGYMGAPNGCWSDAQVAASGNGAAFGSATHSFTFTPADQSASGRPIITLTNGATGAAFLGFYKGYYGGENNNSANPPNGGNSTNRYEVMSYVNAGGVETMVISVDISGAHDGSASWSAVLVR